LHPSLDQVLPLHLDLSQLATVQVHHLSHLALLAHLEPPHPELLLPQFLASLAHLELPHLAQSQAPLLVNLVLSVSLFHLQLPVLQLHLDLPQFLFLSELVLLALSPLLPVAPPTL